jgi:dTDP-4-dehydrorhamnose reductase
MRFLVTGGAGMLGRDLEDVLTAAGHEVTAAGRADLDVTSLEACRQAVTGHEVVVNGAAWTAVDDAETHEAQAFTVNATGAANLARACAEAQVRLVQVSTDYVFSGDATTPYAEDAPLAPRSAYGRTKAAGEWAVRATCPQSWVVRTAWLYGEHGPNFVKTMARLAGERDTVSFFDDQRGQPTWSRDLAEGIERLVAAEAPFGIYHGTSAGETTWYGFTREIFDRLGLDPERVLPTTTEAFPRPAPRPAYSVLGHDAWATAGLAPLPDWRTALGTSLTAVVGASA